MLQHNTTVSSSTIKLSTRLRNLKLLTVFQLATSDKQDLQKFNNKNIDDISKHIKHARVKENFKWTVRYVLHMLCYNPTPFKVFTNKQLHFSGMGSHF